MLIKTLTIKNFGALDGPLEVKLEKGLNIIYGPNESGKSTLMRALWMALTMRAKVSGDALRVIKPKTGAVPEVSVCFEHNGSSIQVDKRYAGSKGLCRLRMTEESGRITDLSGDEAEARLRQVMELSQQNSKRSGDWGIWPLVWIRQGRSSLAPADDLNGSGAQTLATQLHKLSSQVLAGTDSEQLFAQVEKEYRRFFTATGQIARSGDAPLHQAQKSLSEITAERDALLEQSAATEKRALRMSELEAQKQALQKTLPALTSRLKNLEAQWEKAAPEQERQKTEQAKLEHAELEAKRYSETLNRFIAIQKQLESLQKDIKHYQAELKVKNEQSEQGPLLDVHLRADKDLAISLNGEQFVLKKGEELRKQLPGTIDFSIDGVARFAAQPPKSPHAKNEQALLEREIKRKHDSLSGLQKELAAMEKEYGNRDAQKAKLEQVQQALQKQKALVQEQGSKKQALSKLGDELRIMRQSLSQALEQEKKLDAETHELRGRFKEAKVLGLHEALQEAETAFQNAKAQAQSLTEQAEACRLLYDTLIACRNDMEKHYVEPVNRQVTPLLQTLFPDASIDLNSQLQIAHLHRKEKGRDSFEQLSVGTKEQIGLAVRLGTARALAEDESLPVLLDDALVASDEQRLLQVAHMLNQVSDRLQVILLTCHFERYAALPLNQPKLIDLEKIKGLSAEVPARAAAQPSSLS
ncbi:MAG: AAA family ATPase [Myxococcales bacterium]|nr:MAG: AAA family ATPase [Myxococcales bacterium]